MGRVAPNHLYLVVGVWTRRIKIGRANDAIRRYSELQAGSGEDQILYAWAHDSGYLENALHERFVDHRLHHEWFDVPVTEFFASRVRSPWPHLHHSTDLAALARRLAEDDRNERQKRTTAAVRMLDRCSRPGHFEWRGKVRPL